MVNIFQYYIIFSNILCIRFISGYIYFIFTWRFWITLLIDALPLLEKTEVDPAVCSLLFLELVLVTSFFNAYQDDNQKRKIIKSKICQNIKDINSLLILIWETLMSWDIPVIFTADLQQSTDTWTDEVPWGTHHWIQAREETRWLGMWRSLILLHLATSFSLRKIIKISYL